MTRDHARIYVACILAREVAELEHLLGAEDPAAVELAKTTEEAVRALGFEISYARALAAARASAVADAEASS